MDEVKKMRNWDDELKCMERQLVQKTVCELYRKIKMEEKMKKRKKMLLKVVTKNEKYGNSRTITRNKGKDWKR